MSPRIADLGDLPALTADFAPFQPGPTLPPPTGPGTGDGSRPGPQITDEATYRAFLGGLDTTEFIAECRRGTAEVEQVTGRTIRRAVS
ncbi:hypothetical protein [Micromonospora sp. NBRC 107095]|uniref:hypothetical protein n=1 Tax=Micromonospora sp. NBRC 107095 TaxID=3032209 RepID=UPI0024A444ED|nr:hypothetical protein [Micromonospora sp. NBRC 107095]GLZ62839.1 hypothetical protein Misp05_64150 [Micromonospora sp. NBRC 107095]